MHPPEKNNLKEQKIAAVNLDALVSNFQFNPKEILGKILIFDSNEEKILYRLMENLPEDNCKYYI